MIHELVIHANPLTVQHFCDAHPLGDALPIPAADLRRIENVRHQFRQVAEASGMVSVRDLQTLGAELDSIFFASAGCPLRKQTSGSFRIRSADLASLELPWELLPSPESDLFLGCDPCWEILRIPGEFPPFAEEADPGPVRMQFLAAAPEHAVPLDFEKEEERMLQATERLEQNLLVLPFAELGTFDELRDLVRRERPHIVHLSGHGDVSLQGVGAFAFEDERGGVDPCSAEKLAQGIFRGTSVRLVVLSACKSGQATESGLAVKLVQEGIPIVFGWGAAVGDEAATEFAHEFYRGIAAGESVPKAITQARYQLFQRHRIAVGSNFRVNPTFVLARLFARGPAPSLIDSSKTPRASANRVAQFELLGDGIKGLKEGFVGRRRELQRLLPALRGGSTTVAVLTGIGGMGKSTLATRATKFLRDAGFSVVAVKAQRAATADEAGRQFLHHKLLNALAEPLLESNPKLVETFFNPAIPLAVRIRPIVAVWRRLKSVLVLDNFEDLLDLTLQRSEDNRTYVAVSFGGLVRRTSTDFHLERSIFIPSIS